MSTKIQKPVTRDHAMLLGESKEFKRANIAWQLEFTESDAVWKHRMEKKVNSLLQMKWKAIGAGTLAGTLLTVGFETYKLFNGG